MKFVRKDPGPASENSSGGGLEEFIKEAGLMLVAHWLVTTAVMFGVLIIAGLVVAVLAYFM